MATIRIPRDLKPVATGYTVGAPGGVVETETDGGAPRTGLAYARGPQTFRVQMILDSQKLGIWTAFFHHIIAKGSRTFVMPLNSGMGLADHDCTIQRDSYGTSAMGGDITSVTFAILAVSSVYQMSAADAQTLIDLWNNVGDDLGSLIAGLDKFANYDTRVLDF